MKVVLTAPIDNKSALVHRSGKVVWVTTLRSLAALVVIIETTSSAASNYKVVILTTFLFHCLDNALVPSRRHALIKLI